LIEDLQSKKNAFAFGLRYALFEMEVVEDKFSFVGTCFHGGFVDILDLQINSEGVVDRRNEKDMCSQSL